MKMKMMMMIMMMKILEQYIYDEEILTNKCPLFIIFYVI